MDSEDKTNYFYANNKRVELVRVPSIRAVKFKDGSSRDIPRLSSRMKRFLPDNSRTSYIPKYGLHIYQNVTTDDELKRERLFSEMQDLSAEEEKIEFISPAYRVSPESKDVIFTTKEFNVRFKPETTQEEIDNLVSNNDVNIIRELPYAEKAYTMEAPNADGPSGPVALGNIFMESGKCLWAKASFIKRMHLKSVSRSEPEYVKQQWHLEITKTKEAWNINKGDPMIKINICDDGIDTFHPEFSGKIVAEYDFDENVADSSHKRLDDAHGTSCAGVAAAKGVKASGAAPNCSLIITRFYSFESDADEAEMFFWAANMGADIISCSWGPPDRDLPTDPPTPYAPLPDESREAINYCVTNGRDGKGCCIVWAAGNGYGEPIELDGYASNPDVMAIGSSRYPDPNGYEDKAGHSDVGKSLFLCAPSNGGEKAILTADRTNKNAGYNNYLYNLWQIPNPGPDAEGNYTDGFGGTSSATPLVAGIIGLMLSVNPELTEKEVRNILIKSADKIGDQNTYKPDGQTGNSRSDKYGYGRINALKAVTEAKNLVNTHPPRFERRNITINSSPVNFLSDSIIRQKDIFRWLKENSQ
jgi:subtilisin family serine protease